MFFIFFTMFIFKSLNPMKNSLILIFFSLAVGVMFYKTFMALFPCCGILVSYSSGMMIIFCYCSIMGDFENKNEIGLSSFLAFFLLFFFIIFFYYEGVLFYTPSGIYMTSFSLNPFLFFSMGIVVLSMVVINKSMYNPKKSFCHSY